MLFAELLQHFNTMDTCAYFRSLLWTFVRFSQYDMGRINNGIFKDSEALAELIRIPK